MSGTPQRSVTATAAAPRRAAAIALARLESGADLTAADLKLS